MLNIHVISIFPHIVKSYVEEGILGKAIIKNIFNIYYYNPKDNVSFLKRVDARPYGGGPGMVLKPEPFLKSFDEIKKFDGTRKSIFFSPGGEELTREKLCKYKEVDNVILFCGRYEGIDDRVREATNSESISIGKCILTGGEAPAMMFIDALTREIDGVLGNSKSIESKRISSNKVYTRPDSIEYDGKEYKVNSILLSGNHKNIDDYKKNN